MAPGGVEEIIFDETYFDELLSFTTFLVQNFSG
jgi:hypothetical protein